MSADTPSPDLERLKVLVTQMRTGADRKERRQAEENTRLRAQIEQMRSALRIAVDAKPAANWQCPNCGDWQHEHTLRASSSTRQSTLYGVCQACADNHTKFGAALGGKQP